MCPKRDPSDSGLGWKSRHTAEKLKNKPDNYKNRCWYVDELDKEKYW